MNVLSFSFMRQQIFVLLIAFLAGGSLGHAQAPETPTDRNAVYFEMLGNGGLYSFNYERMLTDKFGIRVGYAAWDSPILWDGGEPPDSYRTLPVSASYLLGGGEKKLELGGGITFGRGTFDQNFPTRKDFSFRSLTAIVGYRLHPRDGGYLFRVGVTPFYSFDDEDEDGDEAYPEPGFFFSAGVSFGYRF